jgi:hypothetical protein
MLAIQSLLVHIRNTLGTLEIQTLNLLTCAIYWHTPNAECALLAHSALAHS